MKHLKFPLSLVLLMTVLLSLCIPSGVSAADLSFATESAAEITSNFSPYTNDPMPVIVTMIVISAVGIIALLAVTTILKRKGK